MRASRPIHAGLQRVPSWATPERARAPPHRESSLVRAGARVDAEHGGRKQHLGRLDQQVEGDRVEGEGAVHLAHVHQHGRQADEQAVAAHQPHLAGQRVYSSARAELRTPHTSHTWWGSGSIPQLGLNCGLRTPATCGGAAGLFLSSG